MADAADAKDVRQYYVNEERMVGFVLGRCTTRHGNERLCSCLFCFVYYSWFIFHFEFIHWCGY